MAVGGSEHPPSMIVSEWRCVINHEGLEAYNCNSSNPKTYEPHRGQIIQSNSLLAQIKLNYIHVSAGFDSLSSRFASE